MHFAVLLPWWGYAAAFAAALVFAWLAYARVAIRLTGRQRALLTTLRAITLLLIVAFLLRPVTLEETSGVRDGIVPILVDVSRSMRLADAGGEPRIDRARAVAEALQAQVGADYRTDLLSFGESLARADADRLAADARRSDLSGALAALGERYRGQRLAGVIVISDGGDTASLEAGTRAVEAPVFTVGVGSPAIARDREVLNLTAGEPILSGSSVDLSVSVTSAGFGTTPMELRLTANGRPLETRHVTPGGDGVPVHEVFTVSPSADGPTLYAVEVAPAAGEIATENNVRRVVVPPQGRRRRVLLVEGAPGFEHTFLKRALARDGALDVDSVVRKGQNDEGRDTFFIQAAASRSAALASGYPLRRADLFAYDAILFGNIEGDFFSRDQLEMTSAFVAARGGGLLVLGARSFERAGLVGTPLEEILPLDSTDRRALPARASAASAVPSLQLTPDGATHPATRLAVSVEESRRRWGQLPPLASVSAAGAPRPGAQVLAVSVESGVQRPLIAVQRYGLGRSMIFAGEASWRWRMMRPASDTTYELVWRQLARWLAAAAAERIEIPPTAVALPGTTDTVSVLVRDEEFRAIGDAEVSIRITEPGGQERPVPAALANPGEGRYAAAVRFDQAGVYMIAADVRRGTQALGSVRRPVLVGGSDVELSEPRLNEPVLGRIAEQTGGRYVPAAEAAALAGLLRDRDVGRPPTEMRDVWHTGWALAAIIGLLAAEWLARRRAGLA